MSSYVSSWLFGSPPETTSSSSTSKPHSSQRTNGSGGLRGDLPLTTTTSSDSTTTRLAANSDDKGRTPEEVLDALLEQYKTSALPPHSRFYGDVDPQREGKPLRVVDLWRHAWFVATKSE